MQRTSLRWLVTIASIIVCSTFTGCGVTSPEVQMDRVNPLVGIVLERHDAYVKSDATLDDIGRQALLSESSLIRATESASAHTYSALLGAALDRHDAYVAAHTGLDPPRREDFVRQSGILRLLIREIKPP